jgi:two-component system, cell cycle sensor histidine kinase and response regulator CckA
MTRIMVVEDEPITAADLEQTLVALGYEVTAWVDNGEEAVTRAEKLEPDLVLMDIRLRGALNGIEAARQLRKQNDVPIVFLTAFADRETVESACETQPYGYLVKPFTDRSVATAVQVALARVHAERAQRERERWVSTALHSAGEALIAVDESAAIRFINAHAEAFLHVRADDVLGKDARTIVRFADGELGDSAHPLDVALREDRVTSSLARALLPANGGARLLVSYSAAPVLASKGTTAGAVLVFREASPAAGAPYPEPLVALNGVSMQLAHEINNPLTYNLGALQLAISELDQLRAVSSLDSAMSATAATQREEQLLHITGLLRNAQEGATRIAGVVRELRSFSLSERELTPLSPLELLELAVGLSGIEADAHVRLVQRTEAAPIVKGNKWQLARVLAYAVRNALDPFDPRSARLITLELDVGTDVRGWAEIRVTASGQRSSASSARAEATPAASLDAPPTSVSTAMAEQVIAAHGGELSVSDRPDGRTFEFHFPAWSVTGAASSADAGGEVAARRGSVLVVDDEPMIGRVLEMALVSRHDVTSVVSAENALLLLSRGDAFDAILCDLSMPGMGGQDFYESLRATRPDIAERVIFMTGGATSERDEAFLRRMVGRCISKPFATDQLLPLVAERMRDTATGRTLH